jgi:hypothetical protein
LYEDAAVRKICEVRFGSGSCAIRNELGIAAGAEDIGGFFTDDDQMSHCVVCSTSGESRELIY